MRRRKLASVLAAVGLLFAATGVTVHAQSQQGQNGQGGQNGQNQNGQNQNGQGQHGPNPAATPEVDTTFLYAIGLLGVVGAITVARRRGRSPR